MVAERGAEDLLAPTVAVTVRSVEQVHTRVKAQADQVARLLVVGRTDRAEGISPSKCHRPETQDRDPQPAPAQMAILHRIRPNRLWDRRSLATTLRAAA